MVSVTRYFELNIEIMSGSKSSISEDGDVFACLYQALKFRDNVDKIDLAHVKRLKLLLNNLESQR